MMLVAVTRQVTACPDCRPDTTIGDATPVTLSVPTTEGATGFNLMLNTFDVLGEADEPIVVDEGNSYLRVAVGLDYLDAAPVRGARRGGGAETLIVSVKTQDSFDTEASQSQSQAQ